MKPFDSATDSTLRWPPLTAGTLVKRYKRFLADVRLENGTVVTAHCPNTGAMTGCSEPGRRVYLSLHEGRGRKHPFTWELIDMPGTLVGVNTLVPNRLVALSAACGAIAELQGYAHVRREVNIGGRSRIDLMLEHRRRPACYVEIKNCTLVEKGVALFPDAVTARGLKHIGELMRLRADGHRCVMFYFVQRMDARSFTTADRIDPDYAAALRTAVKAGLEVLAYDVLIDLEGIRLHRRIPFQHPARVRNKQNIR